jgi:hypothetical protein
MTLDDVLIVAPYNAQASEIAGGIPWARVGTVRPRGPGAFAFSSALPSFSNRNAVRRSRCGWLN